MGLDNGKFLWLMIFFAVVAFFLGLNMAYDIGFANGGFSACEPLSFGYDQFGDYVCFNESDNVLSYPDIGFVDFEGGVLYE